MNRKSCNTAYGALTSFALSMRLARCLHHGCSWPTGATCVRRYSSRWRRLKRRTQNICSSCSRSATKPANQP